MNKRRFLLDLNALVVMALLVASPGRTAAQEPPSASGVPAHMVVTGEARHGSDVPLINREEVMVYEGHDRDEVSSWVPAEGTMQGSNSSSCSTMPPVSASVHNWKTSAASSIHSLHPRRLVSRTCRMALRESKRI